MTAVAIVALTAAGARLARRLQAALPDAHVHGLAHRVSDCDAAFDDVGPALRRLFSEGTAIVGICASGVLIRCLAPCLSDKRAEPPVVAIAEDGSVAVPLLGGHRGANALAHAVSDATGGVAAVTTTGDTRFALALDTPPPGWTVANPDAVKTVTAELLAGAPVRLDVETGDAAWLTATGAAFADAGLTAIRITDRRATLGPRELVLHPPTLALGVGCERGCDPAELGTLVERTLAEAGLAPASVAVVVSHALKAADPAVHAFGEALGVPVRFFPAAALEAETPRLASPSAVVFRAVGSHGVAEAAALAAAGPAGTLVVPKTKSARATCAVARAPAIDATTVGTPRGTLFIVGTGPGDAAYRAPAADAALARATDVVGYGPYIDLLGTAAAGKERHAFALGEEQTRCRHALALAAAGRQVALVSSGDPGIYAMAALVFELLDRSATDAWTQIGIAVVPGISAMQLAAARAGAPLGHDFCAISLSDLLTPWPEIERRLQAAAAADFVVALYNPASRRRRHQFATAHAILLRERAPDTPTIVARNLGRADETVRVVPLSALDADAIDMLTLVIVGNSRTRAVGHGTDRWVYTPRGYATGIARKAAG